MSRQHFSMSIDIDAFSGCLLQKKLQVLQVMACYYDKWSLLNMQGNSGRLRLTIRLRIRLIQ